MEDSVFELHSYYQNNQVCGEQENYPGTAAIHMHPLYMVKHWYTILAISSTLDDFHLL